MKPEQLFVQGICDPGRLANLDTHEWEAVLALGRRHGVSGRWHAALEHAGALPRLPPAVIPHLRADAQVAAAHARIMRWETDRVRRALDGLAIPVILLKGAAYVVAQISCGAGRLVSDVDILVATERLAEVERALQAHGWRSSGTNQYDDRYFRQWMHELPPMRHRLRGTVLDVHHNILPRTCRLCPPAEALMQRAIATSLRNVYVLDPVDMTIHSILHGFYNAEFTNCFRDILDVHELVTHFQRPGGAFWPDLQTRIEDMAIRRPAFYALRYAKRCFGTSVPDAVMTGLARHGPRYGARKTMDWAVAKVFIPGGRRSLSQRLAYRILQARSHWIKMPPVLLIRHLSYKCWVRLRHRFKEPGEVPT